MNKRATAVSGSKPSLLPFSPFIHNIKQRIIPKELEQERFEKDVVQWLTILLAYKDDRERDHKRDLEAVMELESSMLQQLPLREKELLKLPGLIPNRSFPFKAPKMCFGWVIGVDEISALASMKGVHASYGRRGKCVFPDDPDYPKDREPDDGEGVWVEKEVFRPSCTVGGLLDKAMEELGLRDKYWPTAVGLFSVNPILDDFNEFRDDEALFLSIYTNLELMPGRQHLIPPPDDIKRVQDWLGLSDREPGWWFARSHYRPMTWSDWEYWNKT